MSAPNGLACESKNCKTVTNIAKEGHIHLLPPQKVNAAALATSDARMRAERAFFEAGGYTAQLSAIAAEVHRAMQSTPGFEDAEQMHILNAGCGEGGSEGGSDAPVAFSSTQALWSAIVRAADLSTSRTEAAANGVDGPALKAWHAAHIEEESGLLPVANVYKDARLWANTEWAAWSLIDPELFALK